MTLIADVDSMQDLAEFVHEDNDRIRRSMEQDPRAMVSEAVELSEEPWSVLIVDTKEPPKGPVTFGNSQSIGYYPRGYSLFSLTIAATYRVRELSGPLAKAGISILYQVCNARLYPTCAFF